MGEKYPIGQNEHEGQEEYNEIISKIATLEDSDMARGGFVDRDPNEMELQALVSLCDIELPIGVERYRRDGDISVGSIRLFQDQEILELFSRIPELETICRKALEHRIKQHTKPNYPLSVALFNAVKKEDSRIFDWSVDDWVNFIREEIFSNTEEFKEFDFLLKNYVHTQTEPERYERVKNFLETDVSGDDERKVFLDVGSSTATSLRPLFELKNLDIFAVDRVPPEMNPLIGSTEQFQSYAFSSPTRGRVIGQIDEQFLLDVKERIHQITGDALHLPIGDNTVDVINYSYVFYHMDKAACQQALREADRCLKNGGIIFIQPLRPNFSANINNGIVLKKVDGKFLIDQYF